MATDDSPFPDLDGSRDYSRVALVLVCLLAVLVAATALPVLAPDGTQSPIESIVPVPESGPGSGGASASAGGGLGALNPGQQTGVGGSIGGESALSSQSAEIHFVVQSTESAYWRTGAYGTYIRTGWEQVGESQPYDGSIETRGIDGRQVSYEVELNRTARALPTVWRPESVSRDDVTVTGGDAVKSENALPAGTTYEGVSNRPPADDGLLRTAGTDYPDDIETQYTQLPSETDERLGPKTAEITANASTPYEKASRIESWLESNKEYSLDVSQPPGDDVASEFVFEMDAGYCEYFATSMVAMLRSQDVPARYVVGYSSGQPAGENSYTVRGMNAHAWVEVYFPNVGWVTFDPTPASERLQQERESLENQTDESFETPTPEGTLEETTATETPNATGSETQPANETATATPATGDTGTETADGSTTATPSETPTETVTPTGDGDGDGSEDGGTDQTDDQQRDAGEYTVTLNRSAAPGAIVEVTVIRNDQIVPDVEVLFNGDSIGRTAPGGTVVGEVPYTEQLDITVVDDDRTSLVDPGIPGNRDGRLYTVGGPTANSSTTFELSTNATVKVSGDAVTGNTVTVTAFVDDVPVRDAHVSLNGKSVTRTDSSGRATVRLPTEPGNATIAVERGSVSGNTTVTLAPLNVTTQATAPLALPWTGVAVNATLGGEPAPGANVTVGGEEVATTGVDGTATARLPLAGSATIGVSKHGQRQELAYDGLLRNLGVVVLALGVLVGGFVAVSRRYGLTPRRGLHWSWLAGQWAVGLVVGIGSLADGALTRLVARARLTVANLRALVEGRRTVEELLDALRAWLDERAEEVRAPIEELGVTSAVPNGDESVDRTDAHATIRESWGRFLDGVSIRQPGTHTPSEIADHAVTVDDLPEGKVATLRDAFRAVEYGHRDPSERAPSVESAVEALEATLTGEDGEEGGSGAGDGVDPAESASGPEVAD